MVNFPVEFSSTEQKLNVDFQSTEHEVEVGFGEKIEMGGTSKHDKLINRDLPDQHPIESITKLQPTLDDKINGANFLTNQELENLLRGK